MKIFLSLVGTQVMGVLNPLLALRKAGHTPLGIRLLPTAKTIPRAEAIRDYLVQSGTPAENILIIRVSGSVTDDEDENPPAHAALRHIEADCPGQGHFFNLAGGMNFQVGACVLEADPARWAFLYPESTGVNLVRLDNAGGKRYAHYLLPLPEPIDVLSLQAIDSREAPPLEEHEKKFLNWTLKTKCPIPDPDGKPLVIGGFKFARVWNTGNELKFLALIHKPAGENQRKPRYYTDMARYLIALCARRDGFGELYHRRVALLTNIGTIAERVQDEGGGKIAGLFSEDETFVEKTRAFFGPPAAHHPLPAKANFPLCGNRGETLLHVPLGKDITPTLVALWSHRPSAVNFLYTPGDPVVEISRESISRNTGTLPLRPGGVFFTPVSLGGKEILDLEIPPSGARAEVNITPGTKGQAAFLALWAKTAGAGIFTIETASRSITEIPSGEAREARAPRPIAYLVLSGFKLQSHGADREALLSDASVQSALDDLAGVPVDGPLFEKIIGLVMARCGADDVRVGVKTGWAEETTRHLRKVYGASHMTEIDVVARFRAAYYVVSCKSGSTENIRMAQATRETAAMARLFGRFAVPLVALLDYTGDSWVNNGVCCFGPKTFTDLEKMKRLLEGLRTGILPLPARGNSI